MTAQLKTIDGQTLPMLDSPLAKFRFHITGELNVCPIECLHFGRVLQNIFINRGICNFHDYYSNLCVCIVKL